MPKSVDGDIRLSVGVDSAGVNKGVKGLISKFVKLESVIAAAFSIKAIVNFSKQAIELASDVEEVQNVVDVAFGDMSYKIENFAKSSIKNFGMSRLAAKQTAGTYMSMAKSMGLSSESASDMAVNLTGLTGDVASFFNISQDIASTRLKAIFTGETEAIKELGVVMTEANLKQFALSKGITKSISAMTQAEKVSLRYAYVTENLSHVSGDFLRTQDSWANQTRILSENWKELLSVLGSVFINKLTPVISMLNRMVSLLIEAANYLAGAFGISTQKASELKDTVSGTVAEEENLTDAIGDTTKANKKALYGFDEINKLTDSTADSASADTSSALLPVNSYELIPEETTNKFSGYVSKISEKLEFLIAPFNRLKEAVSPFVGMAKEGLSYLYTDILKPLGIWSIKEIAPRSIDALSESLEGLKGVLTKAQPIFKDFIEQFVKPVGAKLGQSFIKIFDDARAKVSELWGMLQETDLWEDLRTILQVVYALLVPYLTVLIDYVTWLTTLSSSQALLDIKTIFRDITDVVGLLAALLRGDFSDAWTHVEDLFINNRITDLKERFELFKDTVDDVGKNFKKVFSSVFSWFGDKISAWWEEDVSPWFTVEKWEQTIQGMVNGFANAWNKVYDFFDVELPLWWDENISPWFTKEKWKQLFTDAKEGVSLGWDKIVSFFTDAIPNWWNEDVKPWFTREKWEELGDEIKRGIINPIIDGLNRFIDKLNEFSIEVPEIKGITEGFTFGFNIAQIPRLAQGAVIPPNREFLAVLGDQKHGTNIEAPLETIKQAVAEVIGAGIGGDWIIQIVDERGNITGEAIIAAAERYNKRCGTTVIPIGG